VQPVADRRHVQLVGVGVDRLDEMAEVRGRAMSPNPTVSCSWKPYGLIFSHITNMF
jgi:hypothetical protein